MKTTIELKEISLNVAEQYDPQKYKEDGFYIVSDENSAKNILAVYGGIVQFVTNHTSVRHLISNSNEQEVLEAVIESNISETVFLKTIAILSGDKKYKDIEL